MLLLAAARRASAVLFLLLLCVPPRGCTFLRVFLSDVDDHAVCTDGSPAGYYWEEAMDPPADHVLWLVYLEGGFWCWNEETCRERCKGQQHYCSSSSWEPSVDELHGLLSSASGAALKHAHKAMVPACTSDAHMGDASAFGLQFRGARVVQAVLRHLVRRGLGGAGRRHVLVFAGGSAGARGAMVHLDYVPEMLGPRAKGVEVLGFLDSPLWIDVEPLAPGVVSFRQQTEQVYKNFNVRHLGADCARAYDEESRWKCLFGQYRMPFVKGAYMLVAAQFDLFQTGYNINATGTFYGSPHLNVSEQTFAQLVATRTRLLLGDLARFSALRTQKASPLHALFSFSCWSHAISNNPEFFTFRLDQGTTLNDAVKDLVTHLPDKGSLRKIDERPITDVFRWVDVCSGVSCGTGCNPGTTTLLAATTAAPSTVLTTSAAAPSAAPASSVAPSSSAAPLSSTTAALPNTSAAPATTSSAGPPAASSTSLPVIDVTLPIPLRSTPRPTVVLPLRSTPRPEVVVPPRSTPRPTVIVPLSTRRPEVVVLPRSTPRPEVIVPARSRTAPSERRPYGSQCSRGADCLSGLCGSSCTARNASCVCPVVEQEDGEACARSALGNGTGPCAACCATVAREDTDDQGSACVADTLAKSAQRHAFALPRGRGRALAEVVGHRSFLPTVLKAPHNVVRVIGVRRFGTACQAWSECSSGICGASCACDSQLLGDEPCACACASDDAFSQGRVPTCCAFFVGAEPCASSCPPCTEQQCRRLPADCRWGCTRGLAAGSCSARPEGFLNRECQECCNANFCKANASGLRGDWIVHARGSGPWPGLDGKGDDLWTREDVPCPKGKAWVGGTCQVACELPDGYAVHRILDLGNSTWFQDVAFSDGALISIVCEPGHQGSRKLWRLRCEAGTWRGASNLDCRPVHCPVPTDPVGVWLGRGEFNQTLRLQCAEGYAATGGAAELRCTRLGPWEVPVARCMPAPADLLSAQAFRKGMQSAALLSIIGSVSTVSLVLVLCWRDPSQRSGRQRGRSEEEVSEPPPARPDVFERAGLGRGEGLE